VCSGGCARPAPIAVLTVLAALRLDGDRIVDDAHVDDGAG
jgi:hypothetical protein